MCWILQDEKLRLINGCRGCFIVDRRSRSGENDIVGCDDRVIVVSHDESGHIRGCETMRSLPGRLEAPVACGGVCFAPSEE